MRIRPSPFQGRHEHLAEYLLPGVSLPFLSNLASIGDQTPGVVSLTPS
jgi:hypothetical protein